VDAALRLFSHFARRQQWNVCARFASAVEAVHIAAGAHVEAAFARLLHCLPLAAEVLARAGQASASASHRPASASAAGSPAGSGPEAASSRGGSPGPRASLGTEAPGRGTDAWSQAGLLPPWEWWRDPRMLQWPALQLGEVLVAVEDGTGDGVSASGSPGGGAVQDVLFAAEQLPQRMHGVLVECLARLEADPVGPWEVARGLCKTLQARAVLVTGDQVAEADALRREADLVARAAAVSVSVAGMGGSVASGAASVGSMPHHLVVVAGDGVPARIRGQAIIRRAASPSVRVAEVEAAERLSFPSAARRSLDIAMLAPPLCQGGRSSDSSPPAAAQPGPDHKPPAPPSSSRAVTIALAPAAIAALWWQDAIFAGPPVPGSEAGALDSPVSRLDSSPLPGTAALLARPGGQTEFDACAWATRVAAAAALLGEEPVAGLWEPHGVAAEGGASTSAAALRGPASPHLAGLAMSPRRRSMLHKRRTSSAAALSVAEAPAVARSAHRIPSREALELLRASSIARAEAEAVASRSARASVSLHSGRAAALAASRCRVFTATVAFQPGGDLLGTGSAGASPRPPALRAWSRRLAFVTEDALPGPRARTRVMAWAHCDLTPLDSAVQTIADAVARVGAASEAVAAGAGLDIDSLVREAAADRGLSETEVARIVAASAPLAAHRSRTGCAPPPSSTDSLSRLLQGVVDAPVNHGVRSYSVFLRPGWSQAFPEVSRAYARRTLAAVGFRSASSSLPVRLQESGKCSATAPELEEAALEAGEWLAAEAGEALKKRLAECVVALACALLVHARTCSEALRPLHAFLERRFEVFCAGLADAGIAEAATATKLVAGDSAARAGPLG